MFSILNNVFKNTVRKKIKFKFRLVVMRTFFDEPLTTLSDTPEFLFTYDGM